MSTTLQAQGDFDLERDFQGLEGCNEVLGLTRPDVVSAVHRAYLEVGSDCAGTNTFGTNPAVLVGYDIVDRLVGLAGAGARIARETADGLTDKPRFVPGPAGPGTKLPNLGHIASADIRNAYQTQVEAMTAGNIDIVQIETYRDFSQVKAAVIVTKHTQAGPGVDPPILVSVIVETTGTMSLSSEIRVARSTLEAFGADVVGLNCVTGPTEMSEHLRYLFCNVSRGVGAMPSADLPELTPEGAVYLLGPNTLANALTTFPDDYGLCVIGGCCGTTPVHIRLLTEHFGGRKVRPREAAAERACSSLYAEVPFCRDLSYLNIGERTSANGSKASRKTTLVDNIDDYVGIAKGQVHDGAHVLDLCVDYVGRDGISDMEKLAGRPSTVVTLPTVLDSTEPQALQAGLEKLAGRCVIDSVNYEDGDGPTSRFARVMLLAVERGAAMVALTINEGGQACTADWKLRVASCLIDELTGAWGMDISGILVDRLTFPIATGQKETRRDGIETVEATRELKHRYPGVRTTLGVSNVSFGPNLTARIVLNSVFLHEYATAGLGLAIIRLTKITPMEHILEEQREVALNLVWDRRRDGYDPLTRFLELFEGATATSVWTSRVAGLAALSLAERLRRRIIDGEAKGFEADLDEAPTGKVAPEVINEDLLAGMEMIGELSGSRQIQLPSTLQSVEVMRTAISHLEPYIDRVEGSSGKGALVLAAVWGDVHDIGKNLANVIVSNSGHTVINIGIKQLIRVIIDVTKASGVDAIDMSGLLVKSALVTRGNLTGLNHLGLAEKHPVLLGGTTLTRAFVERDFNDMFDGEIRYTKDASEGFTLMGAVMAVKQGVPGAKLPEPKKRRYKKTEVVEQWEIDTRRPDGVGCHIDMPAPPFWDVQAVKGLPVVGVAWWLDHRVTFLNRRGPKPVKDGPGYEELVVMEGMPRPRMWLGRTTTGQLADFFVMYGYFPIYSEANTLIVGDPDDPSWELACFDFPRQRRDPRPCLADFFRDADGVREPGPDVLGVQLVTMGTEVVRGTQRLFEPNRYREYLELHDLFMQLIGALAEF